ncbi:hypothetical protein [Oricola indica]|uniref:hypothetical protein n=1 Tax=Oricola indica TaxID=2872591 RepID=UPI003CCC4248
MTGMKMPVFPSMRGRASHHGGARGRRSEDMKTMQRLALILPALLLFAAPARAHEIDGNWCSADGRMLSVHEGTASIPSGAKVIGEHKDHIFRYVGPAEDPESGHDVRIRIFHDEDLVLERIIEGSPQPEERWHRCGPIA